MGTNKVPFHLNDFLDKNLTFETVGFLVYVMLHLFNTSYLKLKQTKETNLAVKSLSSRLLMMPQLIYEGLQGSHLLEFLFQA